MSRCHDPPACGTFPDPAEAVDGPVRAPRVRLHSGRVLPVRRQRGDPPDAQGRRPVEGAEEVRADQQVGMLRSVRKRADAGDLSRVRLVLGREARQGRADSRGAHRGRAAGDGPHLHGPTGRQQESPPDRRDREIPRRGAGGRARKRPGDEGMKRFATPWLAREAIIGALVGALAGVLSLAFVSAGPIVDTLLAATVLVAGYLVGFTLALARMLSGATRYVLRLREELRGCQDHIMASGSARALGAYLEATAEGVKASLQALATDARSLANDSAAPEAVREAAGRMAAQAVSVSETLRALSGVAAPQPARSPFNVNNLLREALDLCRHRAEGRRIRFVET